RPRISPGTTVTAGPPVRGRGFGAVGGRPGDGPCADRTPRPGNPASVPLADPRLVSPDTWSRRVLWFPGSLAEQPFEGCGWAQGQAGGCREEEIERGALGQDAALLFLARHGRDPGAGPGAA